MRIPALTSALLALSLAACGGGDAANPAEAGRAALNEGDHAAALAHFEDALNNADASDEDLYYIHYDRVVAQGVVDSKKVVKAVEDFAAAATIQAKDYKDMTFGLVQAKAFESAVYVMDLARKAYPDDPSIQEVEKLVIKESKKDPAAQSALAGLGYLGGE